MRGVVPDGTGKAENVELPNAFFALGSPKGAREEGKVGDDEPQSSQSESLPITPQLLQPSHWAQIILCFRNPCSFPPSSLPLECASRPIQHQPFSFIPPTSYISNTLHRLPPEPLIIPPRHCHLSALALSLKTIWKNLQPFLLPISHQS